MQLVRRAGIRLKFGGASDRQAWSFGSWRSPVQTRRVNLGPRFERLGDPSVLSLSRYLTHRQTPGTDYIMELLTESRRDLDTADADIEPTALHRSIHLRRRNNLLASPLFRLPTELILKIFVHVIDLDGPPLPDNDCPLSPLVLTAICHQLREVGITFPQLWSTAKFITPQITELYLERCKYDPHIILVTDPSRFTFCDLFRPPVPHCPAKAQRWDAVWEKLEGRTFNNLHSLIFEGTSYALASKMVSVLRRAPNISTIDLHYVYRLYPCLTLPWSLRGTVPYLSTLRLRNFWVEWSSPLLRNLSHLTLDLGAPVMPSECTSIGMFLTMLDNCPDLETLNLAHAGPKEPDGHPDNCDTVVQLCRLRELSLEFRNPPHIRYILSHVGYPASTVVKLEASIGTSLSDAISQLLPPCNVANSPTIPKVKNPHCPLGQCIRILHRQPLRSPLPQFLVKASIRPSGVISVRIQDCGSRRKGYRHLLGHTDAH